MSTDEQAVTTAVVETVQSGPPAVRTTGLPIEAVNDFIKLSDDVIRQFMKHGRDYDTIPGTTKPTLLKPGAEKLCLAFNLTPGYSILSTIEDHWKEWEYSRRWRDKKTGEVREQKHTTRGFFSYTVSCVLTHRSSGIIMAEGIGSCESTERGREDAPSNTVLKMAQKRAYVAATLNATFSSDRFTQDMEDQRGHGDHETAHEAGTKPTGDTDDGFGPDDRITFGKHADKRICELPDDYLRWGADKLDKHRWWMQRELDRRAKQPEPTAADPDLEGPETADPLTKLIFQVKAGEYAAYNNAKPALANARKKYLNGIETLDDADVLDLQAYLSHLQSKVSKKQHEDENLPF